jgi:hypothetical protein
MKSPRAAFTQRYKYSPDRWWNRTKDLMLDNPDLNSSPQACRDGAFLGPPQVDRATASKMSALDAAKHRFFAGAAWALSLVIWWYFTPKIAVHFYDWIPNFLSHALFFAPQVIFPYDIASWTGKDGRIIILGNHSALAFNFLYWFLNSVWFVILCRRHHLVFVVPLALIAIPLLALAQYAILRGFSIAIHLDGP